MICKKHNLELEHRGGGVWMCPVKSCPTTLFKIPRQTTEAEKQFEPFKIDLGELFGLGKTVEATVVPEKMITDEGMIHACLPTSQNPTGDGIVPGSIKTMASCGHEVWVAPSGQKIQAYGKNKMVCMNCVIALAKEEKKEEK